MELAITIDNHSSCDPNSCRVSDGTKCCTIGVEGQIPSFAIEDYYIFEKRDILQVGVKPQENYGWNISYKEIPEGEAEEIYFCIDGIYHEAWAHWVDESALYLPLYLKLKEQYPKLKLFSLGKKGYKNAMYKAFSIAEDDVVYQIQSTHNQFLFPYYVSLADHRRPFFFLNHMKIFYNWIVERCGPQEKDIDILYLPRGSKENCMQNDRQIPVQSELISMFSEYPNVTVLYTDSVDNMIEQWKIIRRAKVILLSEGSNLLVNGFFAENSQIISLGGHGNNAHFWNPSPALLYYDSINRGNRYYPIPYEWKASHVLSYLTAVMNNSVSHEHTPKFNCYLNCQYCKNQKFETYSSKRSSLLD
jgi:hypothetical protein